MTSYSEKLSIREKIGYSLGDLAANLVFQTLMTYLAYFYTDIYGLDANDATAIIFTVGTIAAFGFNPIVGAIADRTNSKWGKFRPWILWTAIPLGIISVLAFSTPNFEYQGKVVYAVITYTLLLLLYAASNLPYSALSGVITGDMKERNSISSYRFVAVMFAQFFVQVFMLPIIIYAGEGDKAVGIEIVMTWLAIIGTIMLLITFITTKERIVPKLEQKSSVKEDLLDLIYERMKGLIKSASSGNKMYNAKTQAPIKLDYKGAKRFLDQFGLGFAIRQYIPNLKQKQKVVSYENWAQIALCDFLELEGITINELRRQFSNYLKNKDI